MIQGRRIRILFVCGGNTCRSPMAAAIAGQMLGDRAEAESAGTDPGSSATTEAIEVLRNELGIDISNHCPRDAADLALQAYDIIVAMDEYVQKQLVRRCGLSPDRITLWEIADPWRRGLQAYRRCFRDIQARLADLAREVEFGRQEAIDGRSDARADGDGEQLSAAERLRRLEEDIERWQAEVDRGEVRSTTLYGIARRASDRFEVLLRDVLRLWLAECQVDYDGHLKPRMSKKPLDRLTLGEVYECFKLLGGRIGQSYGRSDMSSGATRRLLGDKDKKVLDRLCKLRSLTHNEDEFAKNLVSNTTRLLSLIAQTLGFALFSGVRQDEPA